MSIQQYVTYLKDYKVLLYRQCQYCIVPGGMQRHFTDFHQSISIMIHQRIIEFASTLELIQLESIKVKDELNKCIPGLKVYENGFRCLYFGCKFCCTTWGSIVKHAHMVHTWVASQGSQ
jgi:hypothetical protein